MSESSPSGTVPQARRSRGCARRDEASEDIAGLQWIGRVDKGAFKASVSGMEYVLYLFGIGFVILILWVVETWINRR